jgi:DNA-binding transcriptional LysR family regulator
MAKQLFIRLWVHSIMAMGTRLNLLERGEMLPITLRRLEVFVAVVEAKGFGVAASLLNISQPSVSVHIRSLEATVGTALFERKPGISPRLTEAGRTLYTYAQETLARASAVSVALGQGRRQLRFAAQRFVTASLLPRTFEAVSATFPHLEVIARTGTFEEVHALFQAGAVDLVFMLSASQDLPEWHTGTMGRYRLAFIAAPGHPLARQERIQNHALAAYPFISAYRGSYFERTIAGLMKKAGVFPPTIAAQAVDASTVRDMVIAEMGIACTLRRSVHKELAAGSIVELDVDVDPMHLVLSYARHPKASMPEIDALIELVRQSENLTLPA